MSKAKTIPACGLSGCKRRATYADGSGVGYCHQHRNDGMGPTVKGEPFDSWWAAASLADERGDKSFDGLEHGQYPEGATA